MKKLMTLVLALVMVFALAIPTAAWQGWDQKEPVETPELVWGDFDLTGVRLEYFSSSTATFTWVNQYYAEYSPSNKGIVEGSHVRAVFALTFPVKSEIPAKIWGDIDSLRLTLTPSNMYIDEIVAYETGANGFLQPISALGAKAVGSKPVKHVLGSTYISDKSTVTIQFMITGYALKTADVGLTASLAIGDDAFVDGEFYFTTDAGVRYKVVHKGNCFYVTNIMPVTSKLYTPGTVRYTVDANDKVTDVAVAMAAGTPYTYYDLTDVTEAVYLAGDATNLANAKKNREAIIDYQLAYIKKHWDADGVSGSTFTAWKNLLAGLTDAGVSGLIDAKYNAIVIAVQGFVNLPILSTTASFDYDLFALDPITFIPSVGVINGLNNNAFAVGGVFNDDVLKLMRKAGYTMYDYIDFVTYKTYTTATAANGDVLRVDLSPVKWAINNGEVGAEAGNNYYSASTNAPTQHVVFSRYAGTYGLSYQTRTTLWNQVTVPSGPLTFNFQMQTALQNEADQADYYQAPGAGYDRDLIQNGTATYAAYLKIFEEVSAVLEFEWDGTTKYMYEEKFIELLSSNYALNCPLVWKAYEADLLVPDTEVPPQTGDSASIAGFVMIALAVLAAAVVVLKKVRA